jgi:hypothetical protein
MWYFECVYFALNCPAYTLSFHLHYDPLSDSAPNRNEYKEASSGGKRGRRVRLTTSQPSVSLLSSQCGILDVSQTYGPTRPVKRISFILWRLSFSLYLMRYLVTWATVRKQAGWDISNYLSHCSETGRMRLLSLPASLFGDRPYEISLFTWVTLRRRTRGDTSLLIWVTLRTQAGWRLTFSTGKQCRKLRWWWTWTFPSRWCLGDWFGRQKDLFRRE